MFKATGGVITEALHRGHQVHLVHQDDDKPGERVTRAELAARWPEARLGLRHVTDAVLGPSLHAYPDRLPAGRQYALDLAWENISLPVNGRQRPCWASAYQASLWAQTHGSAGMSDPGGITGSPLIPPLAYPSLPT